MTYGYLRVSTDTQDVEAQKIGIKAKAESLGFQIDRWVEDEGISGTTDFEKRKLGKLMKLLKKNDVIIASEMSRLARKLFLLFEFLSFITKKEVKLWTVKDAYHLDGTIQSTILAFAFGMAAQIERDMISQRTKEGLAQRRAEGIILGRPMGKKSIYKKTDIKGKEIERFTKMGLTYSTIGKLTGLHRLTIKNYCDENNLSNGKDTQKSSATNRKRSEESRLAKSIKLTDEKITENELINSYKENSYSIPLMAKAMDVSYSQCKAFIRTFKLEGKFKELQLGERDKNPSLSAQGKALGIGDTRDVRRYLKESMKK